MLDDRKLGGVLCEARWEGDALAWVAVGVGINVRNPIPARLASTAVALAEVLPGSTPEAVLEPLLTRLRALDADSTQLGEAERARLAALRLALRAAGLPPGGGLGRWYRRGRESARQA